MNHAQMSNTETPHFSLRETFASIPFLKQCWGDRFFGEFCKLDGWWVSDARLLDKHLQCQICERGEKAKYAYPLWRCQWCSGAFCPHHITKVVSMRNAPLGWCVECYRRGQIIQKAHQRMMHESGSALKMQETCGRRSARLMLRQRC